ncbi:uncharacterized protein LY89DRAFT_740778 [Mollisia scopiformis]|uniref:Uncharacterized protein n=1 Tax=Mollisia scopiformis TaxID=149040 RepID=A0A132BBQ6_MOLSC|nr:uncharacterized protein LY89DRAFT_740778 [Mollisia scopiformis]KUJ09703.1 hypothetical protein LY89DRAFT_740778 [Mollisia scopiformis]
MASGFPISLRGEGRGLEISFPDLAGLAQSQAFVEVEGGLVLDGLHMELKTPTSHSGEEAPEFVLPRMVMRTHKDWYRELDSEKLATTRVFLGWTNEAHILLGTRDCFALNVDISGAPHNQPTRCLKSYGGGIGFGIHGIAALSATISGTRSAVPSGISGIEPLDKDAAMIDIRNGVRNHVIVWDDDDDIGWLIPQSVMLLYLLQIFLLRQLQCFEVLPSELLSSQAHDAGQAAFKTLTRFLEIEDIPEATQLTSVGVNREAPCNLQLSIKRVSKAVKEMCYHFRYVCDQLRKIYEDATTLHQSR